MNSIAMNFSDPLDLISTIKVSQNKGLLQEHKILHVSEHVLCIFEFE